MSRRAESSYGNSRDTRKHVGAIFGDAARFVPRYLDSQLARRWTQPHTAFLERPEGVGLVGENTPGDEACGNQQTKANGRKNETQRSQRRRGPQRRELKRVLRHPDLVIGHSLGFGHWDLVILNGGTDETESTGKTPERVDRHE